GIGERVAHGVVVGLLELGEELFAEGVEPEVVDTGGGDAVLWCGDEQSACDGVTGGQVLPRSRRGTCDEVGVVGDTPRLLQYRHGVFGLFGCVDSFQVGDLRGVQRREPPVLGDVFGEHRVGLPQNVRSERSGFGFGGEAGVEVGAGLTYDLHGDGVFVFERVGQALGEFGVVGAVYDDAAFLLCCLDERVEGVHGLGGAVHAALTAGGEKQGEGAERAGDAESASDR